MEYKLLTFEELNDLYAKANSETHRGVITFETFTVRNCLTFLNEKVFHLNTNDIVQIIGDNGSGKSSIIRLIEHCVVGPKTRSKYLINNTLKSGELKLVYKYNQLEYTITRLLKAGKNDIIKVIMREGDKKTILSNIPKTHFEWFSIINILETSSHPILDLTLQKATQMYLELGTNHYLFQLFKDIRSHIKRMKVKEEERTNVLKRLKTTLVQEEAIDKLEKQVLLFKEMVKAYSLNDQKITRLLELYDILQDTEMESETLETEFRHLLLNKNMDVFQTRFLPLFFQPEPIETDTIEKLTERQSLIQKWLKEFKEKEEWAESVLNQAKSTELVSETYKKQAEMDLLNVKENIAHYSNILTLEKIKLKEATKNTCDYINQSLLTIQPPFNICLSETFEILIKGKLSKYASHYERNVTELIFHCILNGMTPNNIQFIFVDELFDSFDTNRGSEMQFCTSLLSKYVCNVYLISHYWECSSNQIRLIK